MPSTLLRLSEITLIKHTYEGQLMGYVLSEMHTQSRQKVLRKMFDCVENKSFEIEFFNHPQNPFSDFIPHLKSIHVQDFETSG